jgi:hypothetical protein
VPFFVRAPQRYTSSSAAPVEDFEESFGPTADSVVVFFAFDLPGSSGLWRGESALLTMVSGGGVGRRARPAQYPVLTNVNAAYNQGRKRSFRSRRAHSLQNLRLVQKCHLKRSNLVPHCEQKFGLYIFFVTAESNSNHTWRVRK